MTTTTVTPARIAVIDDDQGFRLAMLDLLESMDFAPKGFASAVAFLTERENGGFDCIISDVQMPEMNGIDFLSALELEGFKVPVILVTARLEDNLDRKAQASGAFALLRKPIDAAVLLDGLRSAMDKGLGNGEEDRRLG